MNRYIKLYKNLIEYKFLDNNNNITSEFDNYIKWNRNSKSLAEFQKKYGDGIKEEEVIERSLKFNIANIQHETYREWYNKNVEIINKKFKTLYDLKREGILTEPAYQESIIQTKIFLKQKYKASKLLKEEETIKLKKKQLEIKKDENSKILIEIDAKMKYLKSQEKPFYSQLEKETLFDIYKALK